MSDEPKTSAPTPPENVEAKTVHRPDPVTKSVPARPEVLSSKPSPKTNQPQEKGLVKPMTASVKSKNPILINILVSLAVVAAGVGSGWGLSQLVGAKGPAEVTDPMVDADTIKVGEVYGKKDLNGFRDSAEGVMLKGGIEGEGSHRLLREGGKSQTVYLTSSVIDLDPFVNHKVIIWGETFAAQKANWLMDVGRVEVVEMDVEPPFTE